jgi:hypothetical protein
VFDVPLDKMREPRFSPVALMRLAVVVWLVGAAELLLVLLALRALEIESVAPPIQPWDESRWVALAPYVTSWADLEAVDGATAESVVAQLGAPAHVNRGWRLSDGCAQTYLYVALLEGQRHGIGLCLNSSGRVEGSVGGYDSPLQFDLRSMTNGGLSAETLLLQAVAAVFAVPLVIALHVVRLRPRRWQGLAYDAS